MTSSERYRDSYRPPFYGIPFAVPAAILGTVVGGMLAAASINALLAMGTAVVVYILAYWTIRDWDRRQA